MEYKEGKYKIVQNEEFNHHIAIYKHNQMVMHINYDGDVMSRRRLKMWLRNYVDIIEER